MKEKLKSSNLNVKRIKIKNSLNNILKNNNNKKTNIIFQSFGFKYGMPSYTNYLFDVRFLPNPYWENNLKKLTGLNKKVIAFIKTKKEFHKFIKKTKKYINFLIKTSKSNNNKSIIFSFGCTGGKHRSVYITEKLYNYFKKKGYDAILIHDSLSK